MAAASVVPKAQEERVTTHLAMRGHGPGRGCQRAGNSVEALLTRYAKCLDDRQSISNQRIEGLLSAYDRPPDLDQ